VDNSGLYNFQFKVRLNFEELFPLFVPIFCVEPKARLFIIQKDSVQKYRWKRIFKKNSYNKKYGITMQQSDSLNRAIGYDGT